jgi:putative tricarboxylic transport membrane protein
MTPVQMLALDQFVLWVHADSPCKTRQGLLRRPQEPARTASMKMGGTGSKQEDQIITVMLEKAAGRKMTYIPYRRRRRGGHAAGGQARGRHRQQPHRGREPLARGQAARRCA